ncbi:hypothetical protein [Sandarakinorhabdus glacialis]|uniref:hypothetical protein n=1 Tax=Sandarakinorhabdus glacialis TaxID=1614636 RepID=UPI001FB11E38|nr:hypothetical protein [Polymorphobacter glacialis]
MIARPVVPAPAGCTSMTGTPPSILSLARPSNVSGAVAVAISIGASTAAWVRAQPSLSPSAGVAGICAASGAAA